MQSRAGTANEKGCIKMGHDWVVIGSYLTVAISTLVVAFLVFKGYQLIYKSGGK
jgi:hypothetical protein